MRPRLRLGFPLSTSPLQDPRGRPFMLRRFCCQLFMYSCIASLRKSMQTEALNRVPRRVIRVGPMRDGFLVWATADHAYTSSACQSLYPSTRLLKYCPIQCRRQDVYSTKSRSRQSTRNNPHIFIVETCWQIYRWMIPGFLPKLLAHSCPQQYDVSTKIFIKKTRTIFFCTDWSQIR